MSALLDRAADALRQSSALFMTNNLPWEHVAESVKDRWRSHVLAVARVILSASASEGMVRASTERCEQCMATDDDDDPCGVGLCGAKCFPAICAALLSELQAGEGKER